MSDTPARMVLLLQLAATLYMTGVIWLVQVVHYPLFANVAPTAFEVYEQRHRELIFWVVGPPMLIEGVTAFGLLLLQPTRVPLALLWSGVILIGIIWLSTAFVQIPCHEMLQSGFDTHIHERLVVTNWLRTLAWSIRSVLVLSIVWIRTR